MSVAPTKPAPAAGAAPPKPPEMVAARDPTRTPKVRHAMHLLVPKIVRRNNVDSLLHDCIRVTEMKGCVRLEVDVDNDGIGVRHVDLMLTEVFALTDMLNRIRRRVAERPEWRT